MATKRKQDLTNIFKATEAPAQATAEDLTTEGTLKGVGVGLNDAEREALDQISAETGLVKSNLARYAIRDFIKRYRAGQIDLTPLIEEPPIPRKKLRMK